MERAERVAGKGGSILDVGCGTGDVLVAAAERGWRAAGVEPVPESAAIAVERGLDAPCALLPESGLPAASLDLVTASHLTAARMVGKERTSTTRSRCTPYHYTHKTITQ